MHSATVITQTATVITDGAPGRGCETDPVVDADDDGRTAADADFLRAVTVLRPVPFVPELVLRTADDLMELWERTEERAGTAQPPPFWAFAWAGGQALARYVLDHPDLVAGRRVLDFACGAGVVAIAAARAGAAAVVAVEVDPVAVAATEVNAAANGVTVHGLLADLTATGPGPAERLAGGAVDVVLAGDVYYDRDMVAAVGPFLAAAAAGGATVLVGDPGRAYLPRTGLTELAAYDVPVLRTLEDRDVRATRVLLLEAAQPQSSASTTGASSSSSRAR